MKRIASALIGAAIIASSASLNASAEQQESDVFFDDFSGNHLDTDKWLVAHKNWGGKVTENGKKVDYNGGVVPENVYVSNGRLILEGHGNLYEGDVLGVNRDMSPRENGKRCGAAIATKDYFASGSYEIRAKVAPVLGACSAIWTFEYEEDWNTGAITNHEIDIEMPGRFDDLPSPNYNCALCNTWVGENDNEYLSGHINTGVDQADGEYHKYRFDWHTGSKDEEPRVEFYFDDVLTYTSYDFIPVNEGRLWLGMWFPRNWAGTPDFDTSAFEIDYIRIVPFHEDGDHKQNETYADDGWSKSGKLNIMGDVNLDGEFGIADAVALGGWLINSENDLASWRMADLNEDGATDVYDLCILRKALIDYANI